MSYDGTPTPANYQGPNDPRTSPEQMQMMAAIAKALIGNQGQQFMQHWTQPLAQMAQTHLAMQLLNRIRQGGQANAAGMMPPAGPSSMPMPPQQPPMPPQAALPPGPMGGSGVWQPQGTPASSAMRLLPSLQTDPFAGLDYGFLPPPGSNG